MGRDTNNFLPQVEFMTKTTPNFVLDFSHDSEARRVLLEMNYFLNTTHDSDGDYKVHTIRFSEIDKDLVMLRHLDSAYINKKYYLLESNAEVATPKGVLRWFKDTFKNGINLFARDWEFEDGTTFTQYVVIGNDTNKPLSTLVNRLNIEMGINLRPV